jgi:head-tail adaptor
MVFDPDEQEAKALKEYRELWAARKQRRERLIANAPDDSLSMRIRIWLSLSTMSVGDVQMDWVAALIGISKDQPWRARGRRKPEK